MGSNLYAMSRLHFPVFEQDFFPSGILRILKNPAGKQKIFLFLRLKIGSVFVP
jgi:hypothetical protein